jgi:hypothetical protein
MIHFGVHKLIIILYPSGIGRKPTSKGPTWAVELQPKLPDR